MSQNIRRISRRRLSIFGQLTLRRGAIALTATVLLAAAACTGGSNPPRQTATPQTAIHLYGTDGNMLDAVGDGIKVRAGIDGMKGTTPLTRLSEVFKSRLRQADPRITGYAYAAESYDSVVVAALAAALAGSTAGPDIAAQVTGVTVGGTRCTTPAACLHLIAAGENIRYQGPSMPQSGFTPVGEPSAASYGILRFASENHLDEAQTEYVTAGDPSKASTAPAPPPSKHPTPGPLKLGALLPHTGELKESSYPMFAGALLALADVNQAGGVLGQPVRLFDGDDFTDPERAKETVARHIASGVTVIIGAGASSITEAVLPTAVAHGIVMISPDNTADSLSVADDHGLYFRLAPPDIMQASALTDILMRDGVRRLYIVAMKGPYGEGLATRVRDNLSRFGITGAAVKTFIYDFGHETFATLGDNVKEFAPDGVLIIGYEDSVDALNSILAAGLSSKG